MTAGPYPSGPIGKGPVSRDETDQAGADVRPPDPSATTAGASPAAEPDEPHEEMATTATPSLPHPQTGSPASERAPRVSMSVTGYLLGVVTLPLLASLITVAAAWQAVGIAALDAAAAGAVIALAALVSGTALCSAGPRPITGFAQAVLASSIVRTGLALLGAAALYIVREPAQMPYWSAFLVGSIGSLIAETALAMHVIRRAGPTGTPARTASADEENRA